MDDCCNDEVDAFSIKNKLLNFFQRRPDREELTSKGILKNEPVFGSTLVELHQKTDKCIPEFVERCIMSIEQDDRLDMDGIYRQSAILSEIQKVRMKINEGKNCIIKCTKDVHILTGALKLFFRELQEPLIPWDVVNALHHLDSNDQLEDAKQLIQAMPLSHQATLALLLRHLSKVSEHRNQNRMELANLAIIFGPTLMWPPLYFMAGELATGMKKQSEVLEALLLHQKNLFSEEVDEMAETAHQPKGILELRQSLQQGPRPKTWIPAKTSPESRQMFSFDNVSKFMNITSTPKSIRRFNSNLQNQSAPSTPNLKGADNFGDRFVIEFPKRRQFGSMDWTNHISKTHFKRLSDYLKGFFKRRPHSDELHQKGILKNENVFGNTLEELHKMSGQAIPEFVKRCVQRIEQEDMICIENLYSASGNLSKIQRLRCEVDQGNYFSFDLNNDVHIFTGALKLFLRELQMPLIPWHVTATLIQNHVALTLNDIQIALRKMPTSHQATLGLLLEHLIKVSSHSAKNKMDKQNIIISLAVSLTWPPPSLAINEFAINIEKQKNILRLLLEHTHELFDEEGKVKPQMNRTSVVDRRTLSNAS